MKKLGYLAAALLLSVSCIHVNKNYKGQGAVIEGEGPVISRSFDLRDFDRIMISGKANVIFVQADTFEVTVRTQENILDVLDYQVYEKKTAGNKTLVLDTRDKASIRTDVYEVTVKAPLLKGIEINGAADLQAGLSQEEDLSIEVDGAGSLQLDGIACGNLSIEVNGAGDITAKGLDVRDLTVEVNGAGNMKLSGKAQNAFLEVNGAGDIDARKLEVSGEVKRHAAGFARISL